MFPIGPNRTAPSPPPPLRAAQPDPPQAGPLPAPDDGPADGPARLPPCLEQQAESIRRNTEAMFQQGQAARFAYPVPPALADLTIFAPSIRRYLSDADIHARVAAALNDLKHQENKAPEGAELAPGYYIDNLARTYDSLIQSRQDGLHPPCPQLNVLHSCGPALSLRVANGFGERNEQGESDWIVGPYEIRDEADAVDPVDAIVAQLIYMEEYCRSGMTSHYPTTLTISLTRPERAQLGQLAPSERENYVLTQTSSGRRAVQLASALGLNISKIDIRPDQFPKLSVTPEDPHTATRAGGILGPYLSDPLRAQAVKSLLHSDQFSIETQKNDSECYLTNRPHFSKFNTAINAFSPTLWMLDNNSMGVPQVPYFLTDMVLGQFCYVAHRHGYADQLPSEIMLYTDSLGTPRGQTPQSLADTDRRAGVEWPSNTGRTSPMPDEQLKSVMTATVEGRQFMALLEILDMRITSGRLGLTSPGLPTPMQLSVEPNNGP